MERFVGKVAVVTGASAGIGAAIVEELVNNGVIVAGLARRVERIEELAKNLSGKKGKLHAFKCDVSKEEEILSVFKEIISKLGNISILVNNAGIIRKTDLINGDTQAWKLIFDTNVMSYCIATREAIQNMKASGNEGHIIHINSIFGHQVYKGYPFTNVYGASKFAITALTEQLRLDINIEKLPVRITSISPGYVKTEITLASGGPAVLPMPGMDPSDIADAVIFTLSTAPHVNVNEVTMHPLHGD